MNTWKSTLQNPLSPKYIREKALHLDKFLKFANHVTRELEDAPEKTQFYRWGKFVESMLQLLVDNAVIWKQEEDEIISLSIEEAILRILELLITQHYFLDIGWYAENPSIQPALMFATSIHIRLAPLLKSYDNTVTEYYQDRTKEVLLRLPAPDEHYPLTAYQKQVQEIIQWHKNNDLTLSPDLDADLLPHITHLCNIIDTPRKLLTWDDWKHIKEVLELLEEEGLPWDMSLIESATYKENGIAYLLYYILENFFLPFRDISNPIRLELEKEVLRELKSFYELHQNDSEIDNAIYDELCQKSEYALTTIATSEKWAKIFQALLEQTEILFQKLKKVKNQWEAVMLLSSPNKAMNSIPEMIKNLDFLIPSWASETRIILARAYMSFPEQSFIFYFLHALLIAWYFDDTPSMHAQIIDYCHTFYNFRTYKSKKFSQASLKRQKTQYNVELLVSEKNGGTRNSIDSLFWDMEIIWWVNEVLNIMEAGTLDAENEYISLFYAYLIEKELLDAEYLEDLIESDDETKNLLTILNYLLVWNFLSFNPQYQFEVYGSVYDSLKKKWFTKEAQELAEFFPKK